MPITYTVDHARGFVHSRYAGIVSADDVSSHYRRLIADPIAFGMGRSLADLLAIEQMCDAEDIAIAIEHVVEPDVRTRGWRVALVAATPAQVCAARQIQMFSTHSDAAIFTDRDAAIAWLCAAVAEPGDRAA